MGTVDVLHVAPRQRHDELRYCFCFFGGEQQVYMIAHQRVGMKLALVVAQCFAQPVQVAGVIVCAKKAGLVVAPAQDDVERDTI